MSKDKFFIGWSGNTSSEHKKLIKRLLIPMFIAIPILIFAIVIFARPFSHGQYELGNVKEFVGVYYEDPFPVLLLDEGQLENGSSTSALLVGYGKKGAKTFMHMAEKVHGKLSDKKIKIQGTLIYGDGKTLIELTKKEDSVLEILGKEISKNYKPRLTNQTLRGEIVDPKCWFGVMKPAEGKVHKSCAIRCISGGIPPVLRVMKDNVYVYYILKGVNGEDINKEILEFVGEPVVVVGDTYLENGWEVLRIETSEIRFME